MRFLAFHAVEMAARTGFEHGDNFIIINNIARFHDRRNFLALHPCVGLINIFMRQAINAHKPAGYIVITSRCERDVTYSLGRRFKRIILRERG